MYVTGADGLFAVSLANLNIPLPYTFIGGPTETYQCAFDSTYTTLWGVKAGDWFTVNTQNGAWSTPATWGQYGDTRDMAGSSVFGTQGPNCNDLYTQLLMLKTTSTKAAKPGGYLRLRASVQSHNRRVKNMEGLRLEVTLPAGVSVVSNSTSFKKHGGAVSFQGASGFVWRFDLVGRKSARFNLKMRLSTAAARGQVLPLTTTLYQEVFGFTACPKTVQQTVRACYMCGGGRWECVCVGASIQIPSHPLPTPFVLRPHKQVLVK